MNTQEITIAGHKFSIPQPYAEGHVLTAGEASALNQTFAENVRNNMAKKVKELGDTTDAHEAVEKYAEEYQFGVRNAAGPRVARDPVRAEAISLAKAKIREALKAKGQKAEADAIAEAAEKLVDSRPEYLEKAKEIVAARASAKESISLEDLGIAA